MKGRIKIDGIFLFLFILSTGFICYFFHLYAEHIWEDDFFDFLGLMVILTGTFLRMVARAHKKIYSGQGHALVMTGPYAFVRNPMYLGTFLIGVGFVLIVWPWFLLPVFALLFYFRFKIQIDREDVHLRELFHDDYESYVRRVPKFFPKLKDIAKINLKESFPLQRIWETKEKDGFIFGPLLAILIEACQEQIIFGFIDLKRIILVFGLSMFFFGFILWIGYKKSAVSHG